MISLYAPSMNDDMCFYTKHESINLFIYIKYVWWYVFIHLILLHFLWLFYFTVRSMSWLTFMNIRVTNDNGYVPSGRNHSTVLSPFIIYHRICNKSNTTDVTSGTRSVYPSGSTYMFTPVISRAFVAQLLTLYIVFCRSVFGLLSSFYWILRCLTFFLLSDF